MRLLSIKPKIRQPGVSFRLYNSVYDTGAFKVTNIRICIEYEIRQVFEIYFDG